MTRGTWLPATLTVLLVGLGACGGSAGGQPKNLSLQGLKIPTSQVLSSVGAMCSVDQQSHAGGAGFSDAFYGGASGEPHNVMHQLAAILDSRHKAQSQDLLNTMLKYEGDLNKNPPAEPETGLAADALLKSADAGLRALKVVPPACPSVGS